MGDLFFTACYPVTAEDESNEVIGAFCIEMDMQKAYGMVEKTNKLSIVLGCITALYFVNIMYLWIFCI